MPEEPEPTEEELEERLRKLLDEGKFADSEDLQEIELKLRDAEERIAAQREERKGSEALFDAEFENRLQRLHERANRAKAANESVKREKERNLAADRESAKGLGIGLTIAYTIVGLPLAGAGIGWLIDRSTNSTQGVGIGAVVGAALGLAMAILMLNKQNKG